MNITSKTNEKVKYWVNLSDKKFRDQEGLFLVEGDHLVKEAIKNNLSLYTIGLKDADYVVTEEIMKKISNQQSISDIAAVVKFIPNKDVIGNTLILDGIQDPGNLGTIIRSAKAFNFSNIILSLDCVDLYNPKVIRATEGMIFNMNILRYNLKEIILSLKSKGYTVIGTDVNNGENIKDLNKKNIALVIGNEGNGISSEVKALCDTFTYIKMNREVESLNAGVAASILMYEVNNE